MKERIDTELLWKIALHGSPMASAIAFAILDEQSEGKISEVLNKIRRGDGNERGITIENNTLLLYKSF